MSGLPQACRSGLPGGGLNRVGGAGFDSGVIASPSPGPGPRSALSGFGSDGGLPPAAPSSGVGFDLTLFIGLGLGVGSRDSFSGVRIGGVGPGLGLGVGMSAGGGLGPPFEVGDVATGFGLMPSGSGGGGGFCACGGGGAPSGARPSRRPASR